MLLEECFQGDADVILQEGEPAELDRQRQQRPEAQPTQATAMCKWKQLDSWFAFRRMPKSCRKANAKQDEQCVHVCSYSLHHLLVEGSPSISGHLTPDTAHLR